MTATYSTIRDLIDQEIAGALDGVEDNFDLDGFVQALKDCDLIVWHDAYRLDQQGYQLVTDEDGETPGFWELVERFDGEAVARRIVIAEDPAETMMLAGEGPRWTAEAIALASDPQISDEDWDRLETIREAQAAGEADYFERWSEAAKAEGLKLGYQVEVVQAAAGSLEAARQTGTPRVPGGDTDDATVEQDVWQAAHDATAAVEGWAK